MADIGVINANGEKIFTYLNFEKIPDYVGVVESVEARFAVGCGNPSARQCRAFSLCSSFPRKRESKDVVFAFRHFFIRTENQSPWIPAFAGMTSDMQVDVNEVKPNIVMPDELRCLGIAALCPTCRAAHNLLR